MGAGVWGTCLLKAKRQAAQGAEHAPNENMLPRQCRTLGATVAFPCLCTAVEVAVVRQGAGKWAVRVRPTGDRTGPARKFGGYGLGVRGLGLQTSGPTRGRHQPARSPGKEEKDVHTRAKHQVKTHIVCAGASLTVTTRTSTKKTQKSRLILTTKSCQVCAWVSFLEFLCFFLWGSLCFSTKHFKRSTKISF